MGGRPAGLLASSLRVHEAHNEAQSEAHNEAHSNAPNDARTAAATTNERGAWFGMPRS